MTASFSISFCLIDYIFCCVGKCPRSRAATGGLSFKLTLSGHSNLLSGQRSHTWASSVAHPAMKWVKGRWANKAAETVLINTFSSFGRQGKKGKAVGQSELIFPRKLRFFLFMLEETKKKRFVAGLNFLWQDVCFAHIPFKVKQPWAKTPFIPNT